MSEPRAHWSTPPADQCWTDGCTQRRITEKWCHQHEATHSDDAARATAWLMENGGREVGEESDV